MVVTKSDLFPNDTMGMENKTVVVTTILVRDIPRYFTSRATEIIYIQRCVNIFPTLLVCSRKRRM